MFSAQFDNQFFLFSHRVNSNNEQEKFSYFQPHFWQKQNRIIGSAQGRGTTWFLQTEDLFGLNCALRHYYRGGLWGKINRDSYWFNNLDNTRSFAEFRLLHLLCDEGLPVPKPIGARVEKRGYFYRADFLSERIENAQDLTKFLTQDTLALEEWREIGILIRRLHNLQICHTDLNAHNILCQQGQRRQFWLIDFDKCGQKSGNFWKSENLQRLKRSFLKEVGRMDIGFEEKDWQALLSGYQE